MRRFAPALLLLTAAVQPLDEKTDWQWERDTPMCALRQAYSTNGNVIALSGTPANGNSIYIGGNVPTLAPSKSLDGGKLKYHPGGESDIHVSVMESSKGRDVSISSDDPDFLSKFAGASSIEITQEQLGTVRVPLRSAAAAVKAIEGCEDTKMRNWGIDPAAWRSLKARPSILGRWTDLLRPEDYPIEALLRGSEGYMILRFRIGANGSVRDCQRLVRGQPVRQRVPMCTKLKSRARFKPAVGPSGEFVEAPYVLVIKFQLA